jgi:hypothetical protein
LYVEEFESRWKGGGGLALLEFISEMLLSVWNVHLIILSRLSAGVLASTTNYTEVNTQSGGGGGLITSAGTNVSRFPTPPPHIPSRTSHFVRFP